MIRDQGPGAKGQGPGIGELEVERYELHEAPWYQFEIERREFMRILTAMGGGLMVFCTLPASI